MPEAHVREEQHQNAKRSGAERGRIASGPRADGAGKIVGSVSVFATKPGVEPSLLTVNSTTRAILGQPMRRPDQERLYV